MLLCCRVIGLFLLSILLTCQFAALAKFYPYDLSFSWRHYRFDLMDGGGFEAYGNSLRLALFTAIIGTFVVFTGAYIVEKGRGFDSGRAGFQFLAMMPMAVPGMVLGLAYIFFFNHPSNPLRFAYGTMLLLVVCTITHFYTVAHLTARSITRISHVPTSPIRWCTLVPMTMPSHVAGLKTCQRTSGTTCGNIPAATRWRE
jgi:iron(III) transport system permease protein